MIYGSNPPVYFPQSKRPQKGFYLLRSSHHVKGDYFRLTSAPCSSSLALISSASALETASFSTFGALSTSSFASFSPRPVISRTALITLTLEAPADTSSTSNSSFSSAAAASPPAAATTTPAAADTPNSSSQAFTSSFNSNTDNYHPYGISVMLCAHPAHIHIILLPEPQLLLPPLPELPLSLPVLPRRLSQRSA